MKNYFPLSFCGWNCRSIKKLVSNAGILLVLNSLILFPVASFAQAIFDPTDMDKLVSTNPSINGYFGTSTAISGSTAAVGAPGDGVGGAVFIYEYQTSAWTFVQRIEAVDIVAGDNFGYSLDISGDFMVIGARMQDTDADGLNFVGNAGAVYVFKKVNGTWVQFQKIAAQDGRSVADGYGLTVAMYNTTIVVGTIGGWDANGGNFKSQAGSVYIYDLNVTGSQFNFTQKIVAFDRNSGDFFGYSVDIYGDDILVGAIYEMDGQGGASIISAGSAYFYKKVSGVWTQGVKVNAFNRGQYDAFGYSVSMYGDYAVVGAPGRDAFVSSIPKSYEGCGVVYVYKKSAGSWIEVEGYLGSDFDDQDHFGISVSMSSQLLLVGAYREEHDLLGQNPLSDAGSAYLLKRVASSYEHLSKVVPLSRYASDYFGISVAISDSNFLIGAKTHPNPNNLPVLVGGGVVGAGAAYMLNVDVCDLVANVDTVVNVNCYGDTTGYIDIGITGGTAPFSYIWSTSDTSQNISDLSAGIYTVTVSDAGSCTVNLNVTLTQPAASLSASIASQTNVVCNGGATGGISLNVTGGTAPYTYSWSNNSTLSNLTGLSANTYTVTVTDSSSCSITQSTTISQPVDTFSLTIASQTNVACYAASSGIASVLAAGGAAPYVYVWSNLGTSSSVSNLIAGVYTVTATDSHSCTATKAVTITQPAAALSVNIDSIIYVDCKGNATGGINLEITGGTTPYSYSWSNLTTAAQLSSVLRGTYTVTITDANSCTKTKSSTVDEPAFALSSSASTSNVTTNGGSNGSVDLSVSGGTSPYTYLWSNQATTEDLSTAAVGSYTVTVTDQNQCTTTSTSEVIMLYSGGTGALNNPYLISSYEDLIHLSETSADWTFCFRQTEHIDATPSQTLNDNGQGGYFGFNPIGTDVIPFEGSYDGGNHIISHLYINRPDSHKQGFFGVVGMAPGEQSIKNLGLDSMDISGLDYVGGLIGQVFGMNINRLVTVDGCFVTGNVSGRNSVAGLIGIESSYVQIQNCYTICHVFAEYSKAAGLLGQGDNTHTAAEYCYAAGTVFTSGIGNSFCAVSQLFSNSAFFDSQSSGYPINSFMSTLGVAKTTFEMKSLFTFLNVGYDFVNETANGASDYWKIDTLINEGYPSFYWQVAPLTIFQNVDDVACFGESNASIDVIMDGGIEPYSYLWNTGASTEDISNLAIGTYTITVTDSQDITATKTFQISQPDVLTADIDTLTNILCHGDSTGSISLEILGGTIEYSYLWSNGSTEAAPAGLSVGPYNVTITDANLCTAVTGTILTQPQTSLSLSITNQTDITCFGDSIGSIELLATGGTSNYNYLWSNGSTDDSINQIKAGTYTVTVTDNHSCTAKVNTTITQPLAAVAGIISSQTNIACYGDSTGEIDLAVSGGTANYTYSWNTGSTNQDLSDLFAGTYTVTITDLNNCTSLTVTTLTEQDEILANAGIDAGICYDTYFQLEGSYTVVNGGIWSGGAGSFTPTDTSMTAIYTPSEDEIAAGIVSLTLTTTGNGGCNSASDEISITIYPEPRITYAFDGDVFQFGDTIMYCDGVIANITVDSLVGSFPFTQVVSSYFNNSPIGLNDTIVISSIDNLNQSNAFPIGLYQTEVILLEDSHGCTSELSTRYNMSLLYTVVENPTAIIETNDPICAGENLGIFAYYDEVQCVQNCDQSQNYCLSSSSIGDYLYISKFSIDKTSQSSGTSSYSDFTQNVLKTLYLDSNYSVQLTIFSPPNYTNYSTAFVDWNRDGDFEDYQESWNISQLMGPGTSAFTLAVPSNAVLGKTRIRVITYKNSWAESCGNYTVGETEDYLVDIKTVDVNSIQSYQWSLPNGNFTGKDLLENHANSANAGIYSVIVTNANACTAQANHLVIISNPQIDLGQIETTFEAPFSVLLSPGIFDSYLWSNGSTESTLYATDFGSYQVTVSSFDCLDSDEIIFNEMQEITLNQGWSLFSTYINQTANIADVMSNITSNIFLVKNNSGLVYWPSMNINNINNMVVGQGYQAKMNQAALLTIEGISVEPENTPISLNQGINTIGMLCNNPVSAAELFAPVIQNLVYVKLNNGLVYLPQYQINQVVTMYPDDAFKVMMLGAGIITYPANGQNLPDKDSPVIAKPSYYQQLRNTGSNMTLVIPKLVLDDVLTEGDEIAVYNANNLLVGSAVYTGETLAMPVWGQDDTQQQKSGLSTTEPFTLEVYNQQTGLITRYEHVEYELGDGRYHENSLAVVKTLNLNWSLSLSKGNLNLNIYPNPATDFVQVNLSLPEAADARIELFNTGGQLLQSTIIQGNKGINQFKFNLKSFSSGNYILRVFTLNSTEEVSFLVRK